jgi:hypothetical protein
MHITDEGAEVAYKGIGTAPDAGSLVTYSCCRGWARSRRRCAGVIHAGRRPFDLVERIHQGLLVLEPDVTVWFENRYY